MHRLPPFATLNQTPSDVFPLLAGTQTTIRTDNPPATHQWICSVPEPDLFPPVPFKDRDLYRLSQDHGPIDQANVKLLLKA